LPRAVTRDDDVDAARERVAAHRRGHANLELDQSAPRGAGENHRGLRGGGIGEEKECDRGERGQAMGEHGHGRRSGGRRADRGMHTDREDNVTHAVAVPREAGEAVCGLHCAAKSGRPDSNRRRPAWEAGILPTELRPRLVNSTVRTIQVPSLRSLTRAARECTVSSHRYTYERPT